jgi:signal transduction histidine kinase
VIRRTIVSRSLSAKILLLTVACLLVGEILIYVPSVARFRLTHLQERIAAAHLASLTLSPSPAQQPDMETTDALLGQAGVLALTVHGAEGRVVMLGERAPVAAVYDLRDDRWGTLITDAFATLLHRGKRLIRVLGPSPHEVGTLVDVTLPEAPMWVAMIDYSIRILTLSLVLSVLVAAMLFLGLQRMIVVPLRRVTGDITAFRSRPEDGTVDREPDPRADEIGVVEDELARMRLDLRSALTEKTRLAALGAGMSRIGHDLRNILSTAVLISDRLEGSADPAVRRVAPQLVETLDRAARLCGETLSYARTGPPEPQPQPLRLAEVVAKVRTALDGGGGRIVWRLAVADNLVVQADPDQLFRVLLNLAQNAIEAMAESGGTLRISAVLRPELLSIEIADTGPGVPEQLRGSLFEPFAGTSKVEGNGLGLAICRELARAHGGDIELVGTSASGTTFRLRLPARLASHLPAGRRSPMPLETVARLALPVFLLLPGCGYQGPAVAGYPGLQNEIRWYYESNALEQNATCTRPSMRAITGARIVDETPQTVVMDIRYRWLDEGQLQFERDGLPLAAPFLQRCNGFAERRFTFVKMTDGSLDVRSMSGPQRRPTT